jgi:hypothetical protein
LARANNHRKSTAFMVAVAQLVERTTEDRKVTCSIQVSDTYFCFRGRSNVCSTVYFLTPFSLTRFSRRRPAAMLSRQLPSSRRVFRSERSSHGHRDRLDRQALAAAWAVSSRLTSSADHVPRPSLQIRHRAVARISELERYAEDRRKVRAEKDHEPARRHDGHGDQVEWGWLKEESVYS